MRTVDEKHDHECFFSLGVKFKGCKECSTAMFTGWDICMEMSGWGSFRALDESSVAGRECCSAG